MQMMVMTDKLNAVLNYLRLHTIMQINNTFCIFFDVEKRAAATPLAVGLTEDVVLNWWCER